MILRSIAAWVPTLSITAMRTTSFTIYQKAKYSFSAAIGRATGGDEPLVIVNKPGSTPTAATIACFGAAGCTAGSLTVLLSCKLYVHISLSLSLIALRKYRSLRACEKCDAEFRNEKQHEHG